MRNPHILGRAAESEAERYLRHKGYRILARNLRSSSGELDLVAQDGEALVFVEVKARRSEEFGGARYAVDARKQERLIRLAARYLAVRCLHDPVCRFDVVLCSGGIDKPSALEHIEGAFEVPADDLRW